jgi:hypothetical protein
MSEFEEDCRREEKIGKGNVCTYVLQIMLSGGSVQESFSPENSSTRQGLEIEIGRYGRENGWRLLARV